MTPPIHTRADDALAAILGRNLQRATGVLVLYMILASVIVAMLTYL